MCLCFKVRKKCLCRTSKTLQYPATRAKISILFHVVPKTLSRSPQDIKDNYAQRLKEMVDFIEAHNEPVDVYGEIPNFYSNIENWKNEIKKMSPEEFIKLQKRCTQLDNIIKKEVRMKL